MQVGKHDYKGYLILGDDLAIFDKSVYEQVLKNLSKLKINVSQDKSTQGLSVEMAKRLFHEGEEISPYPLALLERMR
jgi:hypothetical protein